MKVIEYKIHTGFAGCTHTGELEVEDDATDDEIDDVVLVELWNRVEFTWKEVTEKGVK